MLLVAAITTIGMYSCDEEEYAKDDFNIKLATVTYVTPGEFNNFFFASNLERFEVGEFDLDLLIVPGKEDDVIEKLEVYAYFLEDVNGEQVVHGGTEGKLMTTLVDLENTLEVKVNVNVDDLYDLFSSDLIDTDRPYKLKASDHLEFKWVITTAEGEITDTRYDCTGADCQHIIGVDSGIACPNNLDGNISFVWIDAGGALSRNIGRSGSINIKRISLAGEYEVDDFEFGSGPPQSGTMVDDNCSGKMLITNYGNTVWEFTNFNGSSVDVKFTNRYTEMYPQYGIWGQVRLTRTDGKDWPTDLKGANQ